MRFQGEVKKLLTFYRWSRFVFLSKLDCDEYKTPTGNIEECIVKKDLSYFLLKNRLWWAINNEASLMLLIIDDFSLLLKWQIPQLIFTHNEYDNMNVVCDSISYIIPKYVKALYCFRIPSYCLWNWWFKPWITWIGAYIL